MASKRATVKLQSKDGDVFTVKIEVAKASRTIATMLEDLGYEDDDIVPLPNVDTRILKKVLAWAEHHVEEADEENLLMAANSSPSPTFPAAEATPSTPPVVQPRPHSQPPRIPQRVPRRAANAAGPQLSLWDSEFLVRNRQDIYNLLLAANYLDIKGLLDIICRSIAEVIKGKDPEEIRRTFSASDPTFNMMDNVEQAVDLHSGSSTHQGQETTV